MLGHRIPREKLERKFQDPIFGKGKSLNKKRGVNFSGGKRRRKRSVYANQLIQKQKIKLMYGLREKQFYNLYLKAKSSNEVTGEFMLKLLELRLDNVVYRLGIRKTRAAARQFVSHGHVCVNGSKVDIPSYTLSKGDLVSVKLKSKHFVCSNEGDTSLYEWLEWDPKNCKGKVASIPSRSQIDENIDENSVISFYSR